MSFQPAASALATCSMCVDISVPPPPPPSPQDHNDHIGNLIQISELSMYEQKPFVIIKYI